MSGTLTVKPKSGTFVKDTETFSKMDPYLEFTVGSSRQQTSVCKNGGKTPKWTDVLQFRLTGEQSMMFNVMEQDSFTKSDKLAEGNINLYEVFQKRHHEGK